MVEKRNCSFCGEPIEPGTGKMYVKKDGTVFSFCSNKCKKNRIDLGRVPRRTRWTVRYSELKAGTLRRKEAKKEPKAEEEKPKPKARPVKKKAGPKPAPKKEEAPAEEPQAEQPAEKPKVRPVKKPAPKPAEEPPAEPEA